MTQPEFARLVAELLAAMTPVAESLRPFAEGKEVPLHEPRDPLTRNQACAAVLAYDKLRELLEAG